MKASDMIHTGDMIKVVWIRRHCNENFTCAQCFCCEGKIVPRESGAYKHGYSSHSRVHTAE